MARHLLAGVVLLAAATPAYAAEELVVDLSRSVVAITAGFVGSELLLFGATDGEGDLVVIVRGPLRDEIGRRKERVAGIWVNRDELLFTGVPAFYAVASNRPM
ncbi:MAG: TIGR02186 family protein, partial [Proteobacteria bacterium]|nr:TIGR02186 family protein [Pseudomonadota bacterium]